MMPQVIQEILKNCDVDLAKFECYKNHKAKHQTTYSLNLPKTPHICSAYIVMFPYMAYNPGLSGPANQEHVLHLTITQPQFWHGLKPNTWSNLYNIKPV